MWESVIDAEAGEFPGVSTILGFTGTTYLDLGMSGKHLSCIIQGQILMKRLVGMPLTPSTGNVSRGPGWILKPTVRYPPGIYTGEQILTIKY